MNHIKYCGTEIEGFYEKQPHIKNGHTETDGSLSFENYNRDCDGSCRDDCDCFNDCECDVCSVCNTCDSNFSRCDCEDCLFCFTCVNNYNDCECMPTKDNCCKKNECKLDNICDKCIEISLDLREIGYSCQHNGHVYISCSGDCDCNCDCTCECGNYSGFVGEIVSDKMDIKKIPRFILDNYPDEINSTCSNHHHFSFFNDKKDYYALASSEFYYYFLDKIKLWGKRKKIHKDSEFWIRFNGNNHYTARGFEASSQLKMNDKFESPRYKILNFCYNVKNRGTLEIRLFPMFKKKYLNVSAFTETCKIINEYLDNHKSKTMRLEI